MVAIPRPDAAAVAASSSLVRRSNFAARQPGVILVFVILGIVGLFLVGLSLTRMLKAKKEKKEAIAAATAAAAHS